MAHKQITICTLQTMINEYRHYSAGYFDLVVIDECHRSIYGEFQAKCWTISTPCASG